MRWTRQRRARSAIAGQVLPVSEQTARGRTALQRLRQNFGRSTWPVDAFGGGCCVRRSRVVLASVADAKSAEAKPALPGAGSHNPLMTVTKRNSSPGRARRKPLKPLRGESRVNSGVLVVTTLCLLPMHRGCGCSGHPAFPAPSILRRDNVHANLGRIAPRGANSRLKHFMPWHILRDACCAGPSG
jgi:hypothetical protein